MHADLLSGAISATGAARRIPNMETRRLTGSIVAGTWLSRGIADLLVAFDLDERDLLTYAMFLRIMALEKHLKAVLLFHLRAQYESLTAEEARKVIQRLAKKYSHNLTEMLTEACVASKGQVRNVADAGFGPHLGSSLLAALKIGYMETRYPIPRSASLDFPVPGFADTFYDPLCSSETDRLIYSVCSDCYEYLAESVPLSEFILQSIGERYSSSASLARFQNLYLPGRW
jgi:hypothetical protein